MAIVRGNHPRAKGIWPQYLGLETSLRANFILTDVLYPDSRWEDYQGRPAARHAAEKPDAPRYDDTHDHCQNFLSEVWSFAPYANAVALWGDSRIAATGGKAWGGFLSARSDCRGFLDRAELADYLPAGLELDCDEEFDAQLIGLEVDVLNSGKPGVWPNMSKTGVQIVGFGQPCSMAVEVRCQDADRDTPDRRGQFESGVYFKNSLADGGRLIVADFERAKMGLDFRRALFSEGAVNFRSAGVGTGLICNTGQSGEVYGGRRWPAFADAREWLSLRAGAGGIRLTNQDNTREILAADNHGGLYLFGEVYVNGRQVDFAAVDAALRRGDARDGLLICLGAAVVGLAALLFRQQRRLAALEPLVTRRAVP